jgi:DNA-binding transcriptional ArsR family regulator
MPAPTTTPDPLDPDPLDSAFRALADAGRRALLDALRDTDGQTLGELCTVLSDMTRFGVMKHLKLLEEAHLVVTQKRGRQKLHYLNPVPIREIHDRWISRYTEPFVLGLLALRDTAEAEPA